MVFNIKQEDRVDLRKFGEVKLVAFDRERGQAAIALVEKKFWRQDKL